MHIWYVEHYAGGPGVGVHDRAYLLADAWRRLGHTTTIILSQRHHLLAEDAPLPGRFDVEGIAYLAVPARAYSGNGLGRLLNIRDFCRNLTPALVEDQPDFEAPDAIIASSPHPFTIFPAERLARRYGATLVYEVRDLWPLSLMEVGGMARGHPFVAACAFAERFALRHVDLVASLLARADAYVARMGGNGPFVWVPNGYEDRLHAERSIDSDEGRRALEVVRDWKRQGRAVLISAGSMGLPNANDLLLEALATAPAKQGAGSFGVLFAGSGEQERFLRAFASRHGLGNVHFSGRLPKAEALCLMQSADIGYAGHRPRDGLNRYGISPNKIADYYRAGLPVLLPIAPCGDAVSESGGGVAVKADTPAILWAALRQLIEMPAEDRRALGERGRHYMKTELGYAEIAERYVRAILDCRAAGGAAAGFRSRD